MNKKSTNVDTVEESSPGIEAFASWIVYSISPNPQWSLSGDTMLVSGDFSVFSVAAAGQCCSIRFFIAFPRNTPLPHRGARLTTRGEMGEMGEMEVNEFTSEDGDEEMGGQIHEGGSVCI